MERKNGHKNHRHIVKRMRTVQEYDSMKVYASCYAASLNCHYGEQKSEKIAKSVTAKINYWIKTKSTVKSEQIRNEIIKNLKKIDKDVALIYEHHLDLS